VTNASIKIEMERAAFGDVALELAVGFAGVLGVAELNKGVTLGAARVVVEAHRDMIDVAHAIEQALEVALAEGVGDVAHKEAARVPHVP